MGGGKYCGEIHVTFNVYCNMLLYNKIKSFYFQKKRMNYLVGSNLAPATKRPRGNVNYNTTVSHVMKIKI